MIIQVNGSSVEIEASLTLSGLLALYKLRPETVVVEHNLHVPSKEDYSSIKIREGDRVEIVKFMGGG